ncbi:hypothetical protein Tco_1515201 [Tanacetum coccineum]
MVVTMSPLEFSNEDSPRRITEIDKTENQGQETVAPEVPPQEKVPTVGVTLEIGLEKEVSAMGPLVSKKRRERGGDGTDANAPPKVLRKDHDAFHPTQSTIGERSTRLDTGFTLSAPTLQETPADVSDLDPFSYAKPQSIPEWKITQLRFEQEVRLLKRATKKVAKWDQRIQARKEEIKKLDQEIHSLKSADTEVQGLLNQTKKLEALLEAEVDMKKAAEAKNQVSSLQAQITSEERIKAAFKEFKRYEDDKVEQRCAEMDARLDKLSIYFDEELYPHMLTAIAGRRWLIGHGLRLAVLKCAESPEIRQTFANVVSAGIAKGMSEGLQYGIEHGKAGSDLGDVEAYDLEANDKFVKALQDLKDLKYPIVNQLKRLNDSHIDLIIASLHLESDTREDAPQWIRDLRPSSSQLKIPIYPEVCDPKDPWAMKEEISLEDSIAANISRAEKKKKCKVVCRIHGVGSAHHARSDGVDVSVPTATPQGLAILLTDAATQTERSEGEVSPRLIRSKSLQPMLNSEWP